LNKKLRKHPGQLVLAVRQRIAVSHGFKSPLRDLYLGIIAAGPRDVMISDDGIIIPASGHVKSQDNVGIKRAFGDIALPEFFPTGEAASWNLLAGDDSVKMWLSRQRYHPYLLSDMLHTLGCQEYSNVNSELDLI